MADLLDSLEVGITRNVGAASRLRNQIATIDAYMTAQRHHDLVTNGPAYPQGTLPNPPLSMNHEPNPNIDPNLQNVVPPVTLATSANVSAPAESFGPHNPFDYSAAGTSNSVNGLAGPSDDQLQFQIPPELLENFPWPLDMSQGWMQGFGGGP